MTAPGRPVLDGMLFRYMDGAFATDPRRGEVETALRSKYRRGLGLLDGGVGRFLSRIEPIAPSGSTVVIVTTDHGEALGEHALLGHGRWLHDVLTRVVLAVHAPGRVPAGVVRGSATHADVIPTVLELCGLPTPEGIDGRSLVALARGRAPGHPVIAEEHRREADAESITMKRVVSARDERSKFIGTLDSRTLSVVEQWFDLVEDPGELHPKPALDLSTRGAAFAEAVVAARARLADIVREFPSK